MSSAKTAPYGSWKSPITSDLIVAQSITLSEVRLDGGHVYWLEGRPQEQGRYVVVRGDGGRATRHRHHPAALQCAHPRARIRRRIMDRARTARSISPISRTAASIGRRQAHPQPQALTPEPPARGREWRFADGVIDQRRNRWIGVREDHTVDGEPVNAIVAVDLGRSGQRSPDTCSRAGTISMLRRGSRRMDAGSPGSPGIIPTCRGTARMLYLAEVARKWRNRRAASRSPAERRNRSSSRNGRPTARRSSSCPIAPAGGISIARSRDASDAGAGADGGGVRSAAMAARHVDLCFRRAPSGSSAPIPRPGSGASRCWISRAERLTPLATPFTEFGSMRAEGDRAVFRAGAPDHPASIVALDLASGRHSVLKKATDILDRAEPRIADYLTRVESVEFPTTGGETAFGLFYPPHNPDYAPRRDGKAAAPGQVPRRADLGGVEHAQPGHSILDEPRHRGARRELPRQHRLRPRLPRPSAPELGRGRRRRLRQRRAASSPSRAGSTASAASSAAAAPAATRRSRRSPSATSSRAGRAITA